MTRPRTTPRLVGASAPLSLAEEIAAFQRIETEQAQRKARITARGRELAHSEGRRLMPRFEDICREHGRIG